MTPELPPPPGPGSDPLVGRLLDGRYRIEARIARGGMASVYRATDTRLDRTVAVKVMHAGLAEDEDFAQRFVREARAAARLAHPHVVAVHDQGSDSGPEGAAVFLVMEHVPGHTLRQVIREEAPLPPRRALALLEPVLQALAAAHRAGLVHRDVKPENVLLSDTGAVKVADFGLAKAVSADTQHTATSGVLIGTVSYLAPELVVEGQVDPRIDVYAAGVVLYELLTGAKPHAGESPIQVAYQHVHTDVPAPSTLVPGLPDYVDALVARATARDRTLRPADAGVLLRHLHRVASALADGLDSDPDLAADLRPMVPHPETGELRPADEAPDPFDPVSVDQLLEPRETPFDVPEHDVTRPIAVAASDATTVVPRAAAPDPAPDQEATQLVARTRPRTPAADTEATPVVPLEPTRDSNPASAPASASGAPTDPQEQQPRGAQRRRGLLLLVLALVLAVGLGAGAYWFGWARYTTTPGVLGAERAAAVQKIEAAGLEADVTDPAYSETVPAGEVLRTDPEPGERILSGGTVTVVLSAGQERYTVPDVAGQEVDAAQDALSAENLAPEAAEEIWHEKVPAGRVVRTEPAAGESVRRDTPVRVLVSKGRRPINVPKVTGKTLDKAIAAVRKRKLEPAVAAREYSDDVPEGRVISQSPSSGTLFRGDRVNLVISRGPELVEVPRVVAQGVDSATAELQALGFEVDVERSGQYIGLGYVLRHSPSAGDMVPKGSTITLYLI